MIVLFQTSQPGPHCIKAALYPRHVLEDINGNPKPYYTPSDTFLSASQTLVRAKALPDGLHDGEKGLGSLRAARQHRTPCEPEHRPQAFNLLRPYTRIPSPLRREDHYPSEAH